MLKSISILIFNYSPLEQFAIIPIIPIKLGFIDLSITNIFVVLVLVFFLCVSFYLALTREDGSFYLIPNRWQVALEMLYKMLLGLVTDNIRHTNGQKFFPLIFSLFTFILLLNLIGLVPYSFTITSHIIVTLSLALSLFIGINIICIRAHGLKFFSLFLPSGTGIGFAFILVPIEVISYLVKPISLSVRLFANMMAGHTLLKVIGGFGFLLMGKSGILFIMHYLALLVLVPLFFLEFAVAVIQAFVYSILICIYLNDALNLH